MSNSLRQGRLDQMHASAEKLSQQLEAVGQNDNDHAILDGAVPFWSKLQVGTCSIIHGVLLQSRQGSSVKREKATDRCSNLLASQKLVAFVVSKVRSATMESARRWSSMVSWKALEAMLVGQCGWHTYKPGWAPSTL